MDKRVVKKYPHLVVFYFGLQGLQEHGLKIPKHLEWPLDSPEYFNVFRAWKYLVRANVGAKRDMAPDPSLTDCHPAVLVPAHGDVNWFAVDAEYARAIPIAPPSSGSHDGFVAELRREAGAYKKSFFVPAPSWGLQMVVQAGAVWTSLIDLIDEAETTRPVQNDTSVAVR
jgi:hypothetical protein